MRNGSTAAHNNAMSSSVACEPGKIASGARERCMQVTTGEEGFFVYGDPLVQADPYGVPSNVVAAGRCASAPEFYTHSSVHPRSLSSDLAHQLFPQLGMSAHAQVRAGCGTDVVTHLQPFDFCSHRDG